MSFAEMLLPAISGDALEIDELVIRFRFRRRYRYLWLVVSRITHQVLAWKVGDRSEKTLKTLWFQVPAPYRRKLVYTDFCEAYAKWFAAWQHRPCEKGSGKTSVIEGLNNKWRNRVSGLVRKTVPVQHLDDLEKRLWLVTSKHNLASNRIARKTHRIAAMKTNTVFGFCSHELMVSFRMWCASLRARKRMCRFVFSKSC